VFRFLPVVAALFISSCVSIRDIPLDQHAISTIKGKELIVIKRPTPDFKAMTRKNMLAGPLIPIFGDLVKRALIKSLGDSIVQEHDIQDSAYEIAEEIARLMASHYGIKYVGVTSSVIGEDDVSLISAEYKSFPLVLDLKTLNWGLLYFTPSSDRYRVFYLARLRLIDTSSKNVIAEGLCRSVLELTDDAPSYEELLESGAGRLKTEIDKAIRFCVAELSSKSLGM
jgi:hypothetical protein